MMPGSLESPVATRLSDRTIDDEKIARDSICCLTNCSKDEISRRLKDLEQAWSLERTIEATAAAIILVGLAVLAVQESKGWLILPIIGAALVAEHAAHAWCPLVPLLREFGLRSFAELDVERYALKLLRGDFDEISDALQDQSADPDAVLDAIRN
jgi:hypothetical protein